MAHGDGPDTYPVLVVVEIMGYIDAVVVTLIIRPFHDWLLLGPILIMEGVARLILNVKGNELGEICGEVYIEVFPPGPN